MDKKWCWKNCKQNSYRQMIKLYHCYFRLNLTWHLKINSEFFYCLWIRSTFCLWCFLKIFILKFVLQVSKHCVYIQNCAPCTHQFLVHVVHHAAHVRISIAPYMEMGWVSRDKLRKNQTGLKRIVEESTRFCRGTMRC